MVNDRTIRIVLVWLMAAIAAAGSAVLLGGTAPVVAAVFAFGTGVTRILLREKGKDMNVRLTLWGICVAAGLILIAAPLPARDIDARGWDTAVVVALLGQVVLVGAFPPTWTMLNATAMLSSVHVALLVAHPASMFGVPFILALGVLLFVFGRTAEAGLFPMLRIPSWAGRKELQLRYRYHASRQDLRRLAGIASIAPMFLVILLGGLILSRAIPRELFDVSRLTEENGKRSGGRRGGRPAGFEEGLATFMSRLAAQDETVVMKVYVRDPARTYVRMRGMAYATYTTEGWETSGTRRTFTDGRDGSTDGWVTLPMAAGFRTREVRQEVLRMPSGSTLVFGIPAISAVEAEEVSVDEHDNLYFPAPSTEPFRYRVVSRKTVQPLRYSRRYRRYPDGYARVKRLALSLVNDDDTLLEKCEKIRAHLATGGYTYTLEFPQTEGHDWVRHFLFDTREGCCMHFASAMTLMLRTIGIPARLAGGYYSAEKEPATGAFLVRARHAHAWVEAHLGPRGWVTFDPTPTRNLSGGGADNETDEEKEKKDAAAAGRERGWIAELVTGFLRRSGRATYIYAILAASVVAFWVYTFRRMRATAGTREKRQARRVLRFYVMFLRLLAARGITRRKSETPVELARRARKLLPAEDVDFITRLFCAMKYGGIAPDKDHVRRMHQALEKLSS